MNITTSKIFRGDRPIGSVFLGDKKIQYGSSDGKDWYNIKTLWINTRAKTNGTRMYISNIKIYRTDYTIVSADDILSCVQVYRNNTDTNYTKVSKNFSSIINNQSSGLDVGIGKEIGLILDFKDTYQVNKVEFTLRAHNSTVNRTIRIDLNRINNYTMSTEEGPIEKYDMLETIYDFDLTTESTDITFLMDTRPRGVIPNTVADDERNEIIGLDDTMEYSLDRKIWTKYDEDSYDLNLANEEITVCVRTAETTTHKIGDYVELEFNKDISLFTRMTWINMLCGSTPSIINIHSIRLYDTAFNLIQPRDIVAYRKIYRESSTDLYKREEIDLSSVIANVGTISIETKPELGLFIFTNFYKNIRMIEMDISAPTSADRKTINIEINRINNDFNIDLTGHMGDYDLMQRKDGVYVDTEESTIKFAHFDGRARLTLPPVYADDTNDVIKNVDNTMEYSFDNITWTKYTESNKPDLEQKTIEILVRHFETDKNKHSPYVGLNFTRTHRNMIKTLWINTISTTPDTSLTVTNINIHLIDGRVIKEDQIINVMEFKRDSNSGNYQKTSLEYSGNICESSESGITLGQGEEVGIVINLDKEYDVDKVVMDIKASDAQYEKHVDMYFNNIFNYVFFEGSEAVYKDSYDIIEAMIEYNLTSDYNNINKVIKPIPNAPQVTANDDKNTVEKITTKMEWSFNFIDWTRYVSPVPIGNEDVVVYVRVFETELNQAGKAKELTFTKKQSETFNTMWINLIGSGDGANAYLSNLVINKSNGTTVDNDEIKEVIVMVKQSGDKVYEKFESSVKDIIGNPDKKILIGNEDAIYSEVGIVINFKKEVDVINMSVDISAHESNIDANVNFYCNRLSGFVYSLYEGPAGNREVMFEQESLTLESDVSTISITKFDQRNRLAMPSVEADDENDVILGISEKMEYSFDESNWTEYSDENVPDLTDVNVSIYVRNKGTDDEKCSHYVVLTFIGAVTKIKTLFIEMKCSKYINMYLRLFEIHRETEYVLKSSHISSVVLLRSALNGGEYTKTNLTRNQIIKLFDNETDRISTEGGINFGLIIDFNEEEHLDIINWKMKATAPSYDCTANITFNRIDNYVHNTETRLIKDFVKITELKNVNIRYSGTSSNPESYVKYHTELDSRQRSDVPSVVADDDNDVVIGITNKMEYTYDKLEMIPYSDSNIPDLHDKAKKINIRALDIGTHKPSRYSVLEFKRSVKVKVKTIWINLIAAKKNTSIYLSDMSILRSNGTNILEKDIKSAYIYRRDGRTGDYVKTNLSPSRALNSSYKNLLDSGRELGIVIDFEDVEEITSVTLSTSSYSASYNKSVKINIAKINDFNPNIFTNKSAISSYNTIAMIDKVDVVVEKTSHELILTNKLQNFRPIISVNDDDDIIYGLNDEMDFSYDSVTWEKFDGTNFPDISNKGTVIYFRTSETQNALRSDYVEFQFTKTIKVPVKTLWINTISNTKTNLYVNNIRIYRDTGELITTSDINKYAAFYRSSKSGNYTKDSRNLINAINKVRDNPYYIANDIETGCVIDFKSEEMISSVSIDLKLGSGASKTVKLEVNKLHNYVHSTSTVVGSVGDYENLYTTDFDIDVISNEAIVEDFDLRPEADAPNVSADDENDLIIGIDDTMEYLINSGEWIRYDPDDAPDLTGKTVNVAVRVAETITHKKSRAVRLLFTGDVFKIKTLMILMLAGGSGSLRFKNVKIKKVDGTFITADDIEDSVLIGSSAASKFNLIRTEYDISSILYPSAGLHTGIATNGYRGYIINLKNYEQIINVDIDYLCSVGVRDTVGEVFKIENYSHFIGTEILTDYEFLANYTVNHGNNSTSYYTYYFNVDQRDKYETPEVYADDDNDEVIGLDTDMEYSFNKTTWIKYDGTNPPELSDISTFVYVRRYESELFLPSDYVELYFDGSSAIVKTLWVNIYPSDKGYSNYNYVILKIYKKDGSVVEISDIDTVVKLSNTSYNANFTKAALTETDKTDLFGTVGALIGISSTGSSGSAKEAGLIIDFIDYQDLVKIDVSLKSVTSSYVKNYDIDLYAVNAYEYSLTASRFPDNLHLYRISPLSSINTAFTTSTANPLDPRPLGEKPDVEVDDINDEIIGLDDTMDYMLPLDTSWTTYDGTNPPDIYNKTTTVSVRASNSRTHKPSDPVILNFTRNQEDSNLIKAVWINFVTMENELIADYTNVPLGVSIKNIKIKRNDGTYIQLSDILNNVRMLRATSTSTYAKAAQTLTNVIDNDSETVLSLTTGYELGLILNFNKEEDIDEIEVEIFTNNSTGKFIQINYAKMINYVHSTTASAAPAHTIIGEEKYFMIKNDVSRTSLLSKAIKPYGEIPNVKENTNDKTVIGLNTSMEYFAFQPNHNILNKNDWVKYDGTNPPNISQMPVDASLYIRTSETETNKESDIVELKYINDKTRMYALWLTFDNPLTASSTVYVSALKIYTRDGTLLDSSMFGHIRTTVRTTNTSPGLLAWSVATMTDANFTKIFTTLTSTATGVVISAYGGLIIYSQSSIGADAIRDIERIEVNLDSSGSGWNRTISCNLFALKSYYYSSDGNIDIDKNFKSDHIQTSSQYIDSSINTTKLIMYVDPRPRSEKPIVSVDDVNDKIIGLDENMEYSFDGVTWTKYNGTNPPNLTDRTVKIKVRKYETSEFKTSEAVELQFWRNNPNKIKTIMVNASTLTLNVYLIHRYVKIYRSDGTVITSSDIVNGITFNSTSIGGNYVKTAMSASNINNILNSSLTVGSAGSFSSGYILNFNEVEDIDRIELDLSHYNYASKLFKLNVSRIEDYVHSTATGALPSSELMGSIDNVTVSTGSYNSYSIPLNSKSQAQAPVVSADDDNNIVVGLNDTMEYSYDWYNYVKYNGNNPPILQNQIVDLYVRTSETNLNKVSEPVLLKFTKNEYSKIKTLFVKISDSNVGAFAAIRNIKIYRKDGTIMAPTDMLNGAVITRDSSDSDYTITNNTGLIGSDVINSTVSDVRSGVNLSFDGGWILDFKEEESIHNISVQLVSGYSSRTLVASFNKMENYVHNIGTYPINDYIELGSSGVTLPTTLTYVTVSLDVDDKIKSDPPNVSVDNINNEIIGLDHTMEWSYNKID